ncbi:DUF6132 family protein [Williamwhitmania taraxaci]|uniref:Uncharacterized protein n=1 Tax=Williamwhitmania taraxaci TaxID=1640674 RepID=A0A1G6HES1_9BACT|nr:DUF6132 family protein [Williamwhitmania taraxaci]SDB92653.1 hypothetical protein SAMN05216323_10105 [Williamwhitmania taraxaci]
MSETCKTKSSPKSFKELIRSSFFWKPALGVIIGGTLGFVYYHFVGCSSGSCAITSNPYLSIAFGSVLGLFVTNSPCKTC